MTEAFPWDTAPRFLVRDHDASCGEEFTKRVEGHGNCRGDNCATLAMAKRLRGKNHRFDPPGVPGFTLWCSTSAICAGCFHRTLTITSELERIFH